MFVMTVVFQADHDAASLLDRWLRAAEETLGPAHLRPPEPSSVEPTGGGSRG
jgi:hypothetical protein